jgi:dTDP-4-amino-4,6-dideoxygalactose transaminase
MRYPFLVPRPAPLSERIDDLRAIEESNRYANFGPMNRRFESNVVGRLFGGSGFAATTANATLGLMLAIRCSIDGAFGESNGRRYALMPSFTFAATAQAALWCGLRPLFCDVDRETWLPSTESIEALMAGHRDQIAVVIPYATFGNNLDLAWYDELTARSGIPVVVDAAASLGSRNPDGTQFGSQFSQFVVFSMHATKTFAASEAGLVYSTDRDTIGKIRCMSNFGFDDSRQSVMIGLNAKLSEHAALLCLAKLEEIEPLVRHRQKIYEIYSSNLQHITGQRHVGSCALQFFSALATELMAAERDQLIVLLAERGVEARRYFSPTLHAQKFFAARSDAGPLPVTSHLSERAVSLPIHDSMTEDDALSIAGIFNAAYRERKGRR